jgi:fatty acid desaturase
VSQPDQIRTLVGQPDRALLSQRIDLPGLIFLGAHLVILAATGALVWSVRHSAWIWPAMFLHGVVIVHLFGPFHETAHRTAFRSRILNKIVLWFSALALFLTPEYFRLEHAVHHAHTQQPGVDPQMIPVAETRQGYLWYATAVPYFINVTRALLRRPFARFKESELKVIPPQRLKAVQRETWIIWSVYAAIAALSIALHSTAALWLWIIPRVLGEPVMRVIRMSEHVGRPRVSDLRRNTRTVVTVRPLRWLAWNMAFHAEHHALPSAPFHALPALHRILGPHLEDGSRGYIATQISLLRHAQ